MTLGSSHRSIWSHGSSEKDSDDQISALNNPERPMGSSALDPGTLAEKREIAANYAYAKMTPKLSP
jgi:hypothetical protein